MCDNHACYIKIQRTSLDICRVYAFNHFLCTITLSDMGFPFGNKGESIISSYATSQIENSFWRFQLSSAVPIKCIVPQFEIRVLSSKLYASFPLKKHDTLLNVRPGHVLNGHELKKLSIITHVSIVMLNVSKLTRKHVAMSTLGV